MKYSNKTFSVEHIIPFSSVWDDNEKLCICRVGNLIPVIEGFNKGRGNRHIKYYTEKDDVFVSLLKTIPSNTEYDSLVEHNSQQKSPHIIDVAKYNEFCEKNEQMLITNVIESLFPI